MVHGSRLPIWRTGAVADGNCIKIVETEEKRKGSRMEEKYKEEKNSHTASLLSTNHTSPTVGSEIHGDSERIMSLSLAARVIKRRDRRCGSSAGIPTRQ
ncbi:hypothetical protein EVAR_55724_1 [Eumeta japonica]|uniref:Uncharacterized protein n=1 Tax=Eumeta variegata TaxID=151549 RepID=A0A4C1YYS4_EUMVA|nr:hypothetical protein EVAR_55724_1 [Eumeta japonica]